MFYILNAFVARNFLSTHYSLVVWRNSEQDVSSRCRLSVRELVVAWNYIRTHTLQRTYVTLHAGVPYTAYLTTS